MPQIQIRDPRGRPLPLMNIRISEGEQPSEAAIFDVFTDYAGNTGWPIPHWPRQRYALHINFANVDPRFVPKSFYLLEDDLDRDVRVGLAFVEVPVPPIDESKLRTWPRHGIEITGLVSNPRHNVAEILRIYQDIGVTLTRLNLLSTAWVNPANIVPFHHPPNGQPWDLFNWNHAYFDRLQDVRERFNAAGIVVEWSFLELYSWSRRKDTDKSRSPWRWNVNGVLWGGDLTQAGDDQTLREILPDAWCDEFLRRALPLAAPTINPLLVGNEMPEKSLHVRVRDLVRRIAPGALVSVNRNEDTPGQYANMKIGREFDFLEYHGLATMSEIRQKWASEKSSVESFARNNNQQPVSEVLLEDPDVNKSRLIFNTDGCRLSGAAGDNPETPYDYDRLREVQRYVRSKGCSTIHQSRAKLTEEPNHRMIETDWFRSLQ